MKKFGARKLIVINSGKYEFAEIDLSKPVHLAARNNSGKSTLVNSLQFLYIDRLESMHFGQRTSTDSKRHYFRSPRSYMVFECATPTGNQCLLVQGLGVEQNCKFKRFVFEGKFDLSDFTEDREDGSKVIVEFETLRKRLAGRDLSEVKPSQLWEVLASKASKSNKDLPRLGILPLKEKSEYESFREVYIRLLALSNVNAKQLRQLLVKCYAREIGEKQIDVATEYQESFDRAERTEKQVEFLSLVAESIDEAQTCADKIEDAQSAVVSELPEIVRFLVQIQTENKAASAKLEAEKNELSTRRSELEELIEKAMDESVDAKTELNKRTNELKVLDSLHEKWESTSPEMVQAMRDRQNQTMNQIGKIKIALEATKGVSRESIERTRTRLERENETLNQSLANWKDSFGSYLFKHGVSKQELDSVFRLFNPDTLHLAVDKTVQVKDRAKLIQRLKSVAKRFKKSVYSDDLLKADLSSFAPAIEELENRDLLVERLRQNQADLNRNEVELETVEKREIKLKQLDDFQKEWDDRSGELKEYELYCDRWKTRPEIQKHVDEQAAACDKIKKAIQENRKSLKGLSKSEKRITDHLKSCDRISREVLEHLSGLRNKVSKVGGNLWPLDDTSDESNAEVPTLKSIQKRLAKVRPRVEKLSQQLDELEQLRIRLRALAKEIEEKSIAFEGQHVYFSEFDEQWKDLFERRAKLDELEQLAKRQWKTLFVPLAARLNDMLVAFKNVQNAVSNLNRRLGKHQVSNLRSLHVSLKPEAATYAMVETLGSRESLFQDPDKEEFARQRLRTMIDDGQVIDLENLFFLNIEAEEANGNRIVSNSLDEIGSTGTGTTAKAMIFVSLVRAIASDKNYKLHFYIDEIGDLDDPNLEAVTSMAVEQGVLPITANPHVKLEPLAHPEVTNYALGLSDVGQFVVDEGRTYTARRRKPSPQSNGKPTSSSSAASNVKPAKK